MVVDNEGAGVGAEVAGVGAEVAGAGEAGAEDAGGGDAAMSKGTCCKATRTVWAWETHAQSVPR